MIIIRLMITHIDKQTKQELDPGARRLREEHRDRHVPRPAGPPRDREIERDRSIGRHIYIYIYALYVYMCVYIYIYIHIHT